MITCVNSCPIYFKLAVFFIGWASGGSERTVLRKVDHAEAGAALLRDDFERLPGVPAHL